MTTRRRGAILPFFAVTIVMLMTVVGLALDGAYAAAAGRDLQSIADYGARVAADRASNDCIEAPGVICPLDLAEAEKALDAVNAAWSAVPSSLLLDKVPMSVTASLDGTQVIVSVTGCHSPLLLSFLYAGGQPPCDPAHPMALTATGVANVGAGH